MYFARIVLNRDLMEGVVPNRVGLLGHFLS